MLKALTVVVLAASLASADTKVPTQAPVLPKVPTAPMSPYQLAFAAAPEGMPDTSAWTPAQGEAIITNKNVVVSVAKGGDPIVSTLVARRICDATVVECKFLTRFALIDEAPDNPNSRIVIRYAIRGASGTLIEGFAYTPTRDHRDYRFWLRGDERWTEATAKPERDGEMQFVGTLMQLVVALEERGQFPTMN